MSEKLKILIVEDEEPVAHLLEKLVTPLKERFPGSQVILANRLEDALEIIISIPSPDVTLLDLSLPDSTIEQTIGRLEEIDARCPVVIVTGHATEKVTRLMGDIKVPVVDKSLALFEPNFLMRVIVKHLAWWQNNKFSRIMSNISRMKEIVDGKEEVDGEQL